MKREKLDIIQDILISIRDENNLAKPTHILYKSNLSHQMLSNYLNMLIKSSIVEEKQNGKTGKIYRLTDKGYNFLNDFEQFRKLEKSYGVV